MSTAPLAPEASSPTATHEVGVAHQTAARARVVAAGLGDGITDHLEFAQRSVTTTVDPLALFALPTASHDETVEQATPSSVDPIVALGLGTGTWDQCEPFHRSASGSVAESRKYRPTAMQFDLFAQAVAARELPMLPGGIGSDVSTHLEPIQCSTMAEVCPAFVAA